ncbi:hypothetical protein SCHPADRAFT_941230 [Schizopora paradoxa]|uniref:SMAD/FHA domain-containing protein n=1 Tax=Schizopora paradoxa TaxID=27342 RepID=A0A0H2RKH9_9AGAM|nr:hypothetical protein SCHPADRAFT_941230 [Schizopora paradoxa]
MSPTSPKSTATDVPPARTNLYFFSAIIPFLFLHQKAAAAAREPVKSGNAVPVLVSSSDHDVQHSSLSSTATTPTPSSMDLTALIANDAPNPAQQRQSILGNFLRVRPRGSSQSHQGPPQLAPHDNTNDHQGPVSNTVNNMPTQPPSPGPNQGHRRRPAANALQASVSHGFNPPSNTTSASVFPQLLRRRRSANGVIAATPSMAPPPPAQSNNTNSGSGNNNRASPAANPNSKTHRIRLVPHLDTNRSLHFDPISRDVAEGVPALRIGRFTDRSGLGITALNAQNTNKLAFKSKVVSRAHAEVWCDNTGKFWIKDTRSSSGTFLNHTRLSPPNQESRPYPLKDGDVLQLGVDYQGGTDDIYKCVKMRIEIGREWQAQPNAFNTNAMKQLKVLSNQKPLDKQAPGNKSGLSDCCICLFCVGVHQSLFIAPCSHVFHYKCIRPLLLMHHPGFSCPLCRTFANLEEDVEIDGDMGLDMDSADAGEGSGGSGVDVEVPSVAERRSSIRMDTDAVSNAAAVLAAATNEAAANETEVERDFVPNSARRASGTLRNNPRRVSPPHNPEFEGVPEHAEESPLDDEDDIFMTDHHRQPNEVDGVPLPVPTPGMRQPNEVDDAAESAPSSLNPFSIIRPMSVAVHPGHGVGGAQGSRAAQPIMVDDFSDGEEQVFEVMDVGHEIEGTGSSGEAALGLMGSKRKR